MEETSKLPQEPARVHHVPDWETPVNPPRRSSWLARIQVPASRAASVAMPSFSPSRSRFSTFGQQADEAALKETLGEADITPTHTQTLNTTANGAVPLKTRLRSRFDAILPPHRTYFGRTRRFLLLFIILPAFLLLLLAFCLGLGLGLKNRKGGSSQNLPLPGTSAIYTGDLTYFDLSLGACGWTNTDEDLVVAVAHSVFDAAAAGSAAAQSNPNANPLCGKKIRVVRDYVEIGAGNRSVDVTVVDRCVGCEPTDLDLSPAVFTQLAPESKGRVTGSWEWLN